jgi:hypothetical protein
MNAIMVLHIAIFLVQFILSLALNRAVLVGFFSLVRGDVNGFTAAGSIIFVACTVAGLHERLMHLSVSSFLVPMVVFPALCVASKFITLTCEFIDRKLSAPRS